MQRANSVRQAARRAMVEAQDDRALRAALRARPRVARDYKSGDWVFYCRTQKFVNGQLVQGGRWYGAAMVLGKIGRNLVVAHKRSIYRCGAAQLRPATNSKTVTAEGSEENELLGIKNLLEKGQLFRHNSMTLPVNLRPQ